MKWISVNINSRFLTILIGIIFIGMNFFLGNEILNADKNFFIGADPRGYYQYLPTLFVDHDVVNQGDIVLENGRNFNKYNCGVAIFEAPAFFVQYEYSNYFGLKKDLYGFYYQRGIIFSASVYLFFGLLFLFKYLRTQFGLQSAFLTVSLIYLATNLYYYSTVYPGMSHVYSFFCFSGVLYFTDKAYRTSRWSDHLFNSIFIGFVLLIRPINAPVVLFMLLYNVYSLSDFRNRIIYYLKNFKLVLIYVISIIVIYIPQILYWKASTGNFFVYSYGYNNESFIYWNAPRFIDVYFGVQCGWLPYTPVMFFALVGIIILLLKKVYNGFSVFITFLSISYICASWWCNFSCAFGFRSFVEYYPILSIPLAFIMKEYLIKKHLSIGVIFVSFFAFFNLKITYHFVLYLWNLCHTSWSWELYWKSLKYIFFDIV